MTDLLVKLLVKEYMQTDHPEVRSRYGMLASIIGIICNLFLFLMKIGLGLWSHSISIMADAFNNLSDASSAIVSFIGVKMAKKPADADHPFGHGRIEYITAFIIACLVIQVGLSLFKSAITKIFVPEELNFSIISILLLIFSIVLKLWLGLFNRKLGQRIQSKVMLATAADSFGDVATTIAIVISILIFGIWGINIDGFVGVIVSLAVTWAGIGIARDTLAPLIGESIDPEIYRKITQFVEGYEGIVGTHDLLVHNYGPSKSMASIHAEVPNDVSIEVSHEIIDRIERECLRRYHIFLVIHMDPIETRDERVVGLRRQLELVLAELDPRIEYHDFRMVPGTEEINLIFDLVVPRDYSKEKEVWVKQEIAEKLFVENYKIHCIITIENSFCVQNEKITSKMQ